MFSSPSSGAVTMHPSESVPLLEMHELDLVYMLCISSASCKILWVICTWPLTPGERNSSPESSPRSSPESRFVVSQTSPTTETIYYYDAVHRIWRSRSTYPSAVSCSSQTLLLKEGKNLASAYIDLHVRRFSCSLASQIICFPAARVRKWVGRVWWLKPNSLPDCRFLLESSEAKISQCSSHVMPNTHASETRCTRTSCVHVRITWMRICDMLWRYAIDHALGITWQLHYRSSDQEARQGQKVINEMITCLYKPNAMEIIPEAFSPLYPQAFIRVINSLDSPD